MKFGSWTYDGNQVKCLVHSLVHGTRVHSTPSTPFTLYTEYSTHQNSELSTRYSVPSAEVTITLFATHTPIHAHAQTIKQSQDNE